LQIDKHHQILFAGGPNTRITNPRWRTTTILKKSQKIAISQHWFDKSSRNWQLDAILPFNATDRLNLELLKSQDGGRSPS